MKNPTLFVASILTLVGFLCVFIVLSALLPWPWRVAGPIVGTVASVGWFVALPKLGA